MPLPLIIGAASLLLGATGLYKGVNAVGKNSDAKEMISNAQWDLQEACNTMESEKEVLNDRLSEFGQFKLNIFESQIKNLVELVKKCKEASSSFEHKNITFTNEEIKDLDAAVLNTLEISSGLTNGALSGALTAFGAYSSVGMLATASTGTAIGTLSGAAATNATLAWLGGGSLATGGMGMAGGTAVLGGIVAGPLIGITGFVMDSKAEQNLTNAYKFQSDVEIEIENINASIEEYKSIAAYSNELQDTISQLADRFNNIYANILADEKKIGLWEKIINFFKKSKICQRQDFEGLLIIGKNLKILLDIPLINEDGTKNKNFTSEIKKITL